MPKGRGANSSRAMRPHSRGSQAGNLRKYSMKTLSSRSKPKFAPVNVEGVMKETATLLDKLRKRFRRKARS